MKKLLVILIVSMAIQTAHALPVNYSLLDGVTATADAVWNSIPENAIDGNYNTGWNAGSHWYRGYNRMHWLQIDLGSVYEVNQFSLFSINRENSNFPGYSIHYNLFASIDNSMWSKVVSGSLIDSHQTDYMDNIVIDPLLTQFVRLEVVGGSHWSHLNEIEIWGEMNDVVEINSDPVPEPATILLMGIGLLGLVGYRRRKLVTKI